MIFNAATKKSTTLRFFKYDGYEEISHIDVDVATQTAKVSGNYHWKAVGAPSLGHEQLQSTDITLHELACDDPNFKTCTGGDPEETLDFDDIMSGC